MKSVYLKKKKAFRFVCSLCRVRDICEALPLLHSPHPGVVLCVVLLLLHILHVYVRLPCSPAAGPMRKSLSFITLH